MINFENAIRMDKIATMSASELAQIQDLLTPKESKTALQQVKDMLANGTSLWDMPIHTLMDAIEIKMNSVGYYHFSVDGSFYDLYTLAELLIDYYEYDKLKCDIANVIYETDYFGYGDDDE